VPAILPCATQSANFTGGKEAYEAFQVLKTYLAHLPRIASPLPGQKLELYLVISEQAISVVLVVERAKEQISVYYLSHALAGAEVNYPLREKFAYTLVMASRKLQPYFEAHRITSSLTNP